MKIPLPQKDEHFTQLIFCAFFIIIETLCFSACFYRYIFSLSTVNDLRSNIGQIVTIFSGFSSIVCLLFITKSLDTKAFLFITKYILPIILALTVSKTILFVFF